MLEDVKRVYVEIEEDLHTWLARYAAEGNTHISAVVRFAIEELRTDCEDAAPEDWWDKWRTKNRAKGG